MAQHIPLLARYRDLTVAQVARLTEDECYQLFLKTRWPETDGEAVCSTCGTGAWTLGDHSRAGDPRQYRCTSCRKKFTVTSGTLLHSRKLPFSTIIMAVKLFTMAAKGIPNLLLGNESDMSVKSAFVLAHKMRESQIKAQLGRKLEGIVEIDGSYVGGHYHQPNEKSEHLDLRKHAEVNAKRMAVVIARERSTSDRVGLAICGVFKHESDGRPMIYDGVDRQALVYADDASHWDAMHAVFNTGRVNHSKRFYDKGVCTNQAESLFSRVDKMELGTHHHIAGDFLWGYACDAVWREEHRRDTQSEKFTSVLAGLLQNTSSRTMKGYWQKYLIKRAMGIPVWKRGPSPPEQKAAQAAAAAGITPPRTTSAARSFDDGRMSREDAIKAFGPDAADDMNGAPSGGKPVGRKQRKPFAPRVDHGLPAPWSELLRPVGLPSMEP